MAEPLLQLRHVTKTFGSLVANDSVDLDVLPGRVHALVGENGAGKTTLMSMINGTGVPDSGTILFDGKEVSITTPQQAAALGIGMVFQHFKLVNSLTVAANVFLGREITKNAQLDTASMEAEVTQLSARFGLEVDPTEITSELSVGELQRVEVLKALSHETRLLVLDEPTAVLTPSETDDMFVVIRDLAKAGVAVIFISHKLDEVLAVADVVTVIRDGRVIDTVPAVGLTKERIATMMVGREVLLRIEHTPAHPSDTVLEVAGLTVVDDRGVTALDHVSLSVRAGEIVGIAGVDGNGQSELLEAIAGLGKPSHGTVTLKGEDITRASIATRRAAGMAYIPDDRHQVGTAPRMSVADNVGATHLSPPVARAGWLSMSGLSQFAARLIKTFDIRGATPTTPVGSLSGGNMQKVVIAREFESNPPLLVVSQPTRGVDVGAMEFVHGALVSARDRGAAVLLVSADLNEVMSLSDRLLVIHRGHIVDEFTHDTMSEIAVGLAMGGQAVDEDAVAAANALHAEKIRRLAAELHDEGTTDALPEKAPEAPATEEAATTEEALPSRATGSTILKTVFTNAAQPILAIVAALVVGAIIIAMIGQDPGAAYSELFLSPLTTPYGIGALLAHTVQLMILSGAVIVSFRAGFFNIGGEGQLYVGALAGALTGIALKDSPLPSVLVIIMVLAVAFLVGGVWGWIPGALLAFWNVNIIVTTLMMSSIATLLTQYLVTGPFVDKTYGSVGSKKLGENAMLPVFNAEYSFTPDIIIAFVIVIILALVLTRSVWGLRVRELGEMNRFAEYTGVNPRTMSMQVMALSGAVAGLSGALYVIGPNSTARFVQTFSPAYGFTALTVALLARLNPWVAILAAVFYADMIAGSSSMQANANVPKPLVDVILGLIVLMITASFAWNWSRRKKVGKSVAAVQDESVTVEGSVK